MDTYYNPEHSLELFPLDHDLYPPLVEGVDYIPWRNQPPVEWCDGMRQALSEANKRRIADGSHPLLDTSKREDTETNRARAIERNKTPLMREVARQNAIKRNKYNNPSKVKATCPHCGKEGSRPAMLRWHFDNCKLRSI
jgi:hypothetical protein